MSELIHKALEDARQIMSSLDRKYENGYTQNEVDYILAHLNDLYPMTEEYYHRFDGGDTCLIMEDGSVLNYVRDVDRKIILAIKTYFK